MVRGIDKFREFFTGYEGNYVIIGGTACEMYEEIYAQTPRATKDIDIILIVEALSSDFAAKFWEFVKTAGYRQRNKGTGKSGFPVSDRTLFTKYRGCQIPGRCPHYPHSG